MDENVAQRAKGISLIAEAISPRFSSASYARELAAHIHDRVLEWKPLASAPRDNRFVELRGDSGMHAYPFRVMIARYETQRADPGLSQKENDERCWRTVLGDHCTDDGPMPTHWREAL